MFKLIISPEFGERLDLQGHTRALMAQMARDLGTTLEWVAASHYNTRHPHVHVALRGIDGRGNDLFYDWNATIFARASGATRKTFVRHNWVTARRLMPKKRSAGKSISTAAPPLIDRLIHRGAASVNDDPVYFPITLEANTAAGFAKVQQFHTAARLKFLEIS